MENKMKEIANMFGVELLEEFKIVPSEYGKTIGCKEDNNIYRFDSEFMHKGYDDGYSEWYGWNEKQFYKLCIGLYEVDKKESK